MKIQGRKCEWDYGDSAQHILALKKMWRNKVFLPSKSFRRP